MRVRGTTGSIEICREMKEQYVAQKIEDGFLHRGISPFGCIDGAIDNSAIFVAHWLTRGDIGSVDRKTSDRLTHSTRKCFECEIPIPPASFRKPIEHVAQN